MGKVKTISGFPGIENMHKTLFLAAGWFFVCVGVVGIFLPLLPTTPFLLLAAWCFGKSSERVHSWLMNHPRLGPPVRDWQNHGVINLNAKWLATGMMVAAMSFPLLIVKVPAWARWTSAITMACVLTFIWSRPSRPRSK